jgi:hypothetical protein
MMLPYRMIYRLEAGWLLCLDGAMFEVVDTIMGKAMPGKNPKTPHAVLQGSQGKQANLYLKGHRLAIMRGRQSSPVVHAIIVSKGGRDSDLIKVADEATLRAQEHEAMLSKLAPGSKVFVNARTYTAIGSDMIPVKPRSKVTQRAVYLRASNGSLHTLLRDGSELRIRSGKTTKRVKGLKLKA